MNTCIMCNKTGKKHRINKNLKQVEWCIDCSKDDKFKFLKQSYRNRMQVSKKENKVFNWSIKDYFSFAFSNNFNTLFDNWLTNNKVRHLTPSIDRIIPGCKGGEYSPQNCRWVTLGENIAAQTEQQIQGGKGFPSHLKGTVNTGNNKAKGVIVIDTITNTTVEYRTLKEASNKIGQSQRNISYFKNRTTKLKGRYWIKTK